MGPEDSTDFNTLLFEKHATTTLSSDWPTEEEPYNKYKFTGVEIIFSQDITIYKRSTYSFLEWLGDVGGLYDGLKILIFLILSPISAFALKTEVLVSIFHINKPHQDV